MRIGVICPIGPIDRFGYQYNYPITINSLAQFADQVYLVSSSRHHDSFCSFLKSFSNISLISNQNTWFTLDENGDEYFQIARLEENLNIALEQCKSDRLEVAIQIHINQYVQDYVRPNLRNVSQEMFKSGKPYSWLYKKYQYGNRIFHADTRLPWIINLTMNDPFVIRADSLQRSDGGERVQIQHGDYHHADPNAIVDCPMELTLNDLKLIREYTRHYIELNPNAVTEFDWNQYFHYYLSKLNKKVLSNEKLDPTGEEIARRSQDDFLSWIFLENYKRPGLSRRIIEILRKGKTGR